jgi:outer membrane protein assembly factor BamB
MFLGIYNRLIKTNELLPTALPIIAGVPDNQKWYQLRGPSGMGLSTAENLPQSWNIEQNQNVVWKVPIPAPGNSSPIIWGDRLYLTGGDFQQRKVFCYNRYNGQMNWTCSIRTEAVLNEDLKESKDTGLCAPTPVIDGKVIVAFFGTNELVGMDLQGGQIWSRWFGEPDSDFGIASSPMLYDGKVFLQLDQGNKEKPHSVLYAIDPLSGKTLWEVKREVPCSWSSPLCINTGTREEVVTASDPWVISYNPKNGREWWRAKVLSGAVAPLPVFGGGSFFTATEYAQLSAIRSGGEGDISKTHVAWTNSSDLPDVASPVTDGKSLLLPNGTGKVRCFDVKTGKRLWTQKFDNGFWSSPTLVNGLVYLTDMEGTTYLFTLKEKYESLATIPLNEKVITSFAVAESYLYLRGEKTLFCLGNKP